MGRVESIEEAIRGLSEEELAQFREWFAAFDAAAWDAQIERDAAEGKLERLAEEAREEYRRGQAREI